MSGNPSRKSRDKGYSHVVCEVQACGDGRQVGTETGGKQFKTTSEYVPEKYKG